MKRSLEGPALRMLRQHRQLTQGQLAKISGVSRAAISDFERGKREAGPEALERLLGALELPKRAWQDTVRHIQWIEWLAERRGRNGERGAVETSGPHAAGRARVIEHVAESACRDLERHLIEILRIVTRQRCRDDAG